jgi:hypothetical protein
MAMGKEDSGALPSSVKVEEGKKAMPLEYVDEGRPHQTAPPSEEAIEAAEYRVRVLKGEHLDDVEEPGSKRESEVLRALKARVAPSPRAYILDEVEMDHEARAKTEARELARINYREDAKS